MVTINGALAIDIQGQVVADTIAGIAVLGHRRPRGLHRRPVALARGPLAALHVLDDRGRRRDALADRALVRRRRGDHDARATRSTSSSPSTAPPSSRARRSTSAARRSPRSPTRTSATSCWRRRSAPRAGAPRSRLRPDRRLGLGRRGLRLERAASAWARLSRLRIRTRVSTSPSAAIAEPPRKAAWKPSVSAFGSAAGSPPAARHHVLGPRVGDRRQHGEAERAADLLRGVDQAARQARTRARGRRRRRRSSSSRRRTRARPRRAATDRGCRLRSRRPRDTCENQASATAIKAIPAASTGLKPTRVTSCEAIPDGDDDRHRQRQVGESPASIGL